MLLFFERFVIFMRNDREKVGKGKGHVGVNFGPQPGSIP
jgi:hypothetical protein